MSAEASYKDFIPVFETLNEAIVIFDNETILWTNEAYLTLMGYTPDEIIGKPALGRVHPDEVQEAIRNISEYTSTGERSSGTWRIRKKDGSYKTIVSHTSVLPGLEKTVTVSVVRPIDQTQGDIVSKITEAGLRHEILSSLTVIVGYLELMKVHENVKMSPDLEIWFANIDKHIQKINDYLQKIT
jgi:PAS domain S-box-containing protein